jgi:5-methyltetrahydrofolate--homocysteine methyltransferase
VGGEVKAKATFAIGTVKGDLHDIGKNLVAMMLESVGYEVINLGVDLDASVFVEEVKKGAACIGLSALLTTTVTQMQLVIDSLKEAGLREKCKVWVGGAPVTQEFADEIGADFYAVDAAHCIDQLNSIYGK